MEFKEVKEIIVKRAKEKNACSDEYSKLLKVESLEKLMNLIKTNSSWVRDNDLFTDVESINYFNLSLPNLFNSGRWNSGYGNSGYGNSGDRNSGCGNSGYGNSGYRNSGGWNSCDYSSGYFNSETSDTIIVFNKKCKREDWDNAIKPNFIYNVNTNIWISIESMTDKEKTDNPSAEITNGYLKTVSYKDAWRIAFESATVEDIELLKALPNFKGKVFKKITGIKIKQQNGKESIRLRREQK